MRLQQEKHWQGKSVGRGTNTLLLQVIKEKYMNKEEHGRIVSDQKTIEWEVCKFYWMLYRKQEVEISNDEIKQMTGLLKKISNEEKIRLEQKITMDEISKSLKNTRNNVTPGWGGFSALPIND